MAQICHTCRHTTAVIHCVTEALNFCLTCDYLRHSNNEHVRYQLCDNCMIKPALLLCCDEGISLCQSCYSLHYNCSVSGHHIQIVNRYPLQYPNNNSNQQRHHEDVAHVGGQQITPRMLNEMSCNGNNNCERWMFAVGCESCFASNAVVYCFEHNKLLCDHCNRMIHLHEPPHTRCMLCVTCKKPRMEPII